MPDPPISIEPDLCKRSGGVGFHKQKGIRQRGLLGFFCDGLFFAPEPHLRKKEWMLLSVNRWNSLSSWRLLVWIPYQPGGVDSG